MAFRVGKKSHNDWTNRFGAAHKHDEVESTGVEHDQMSDSDRAGEDREIDRLQKELLAFVVDQLTTQADSSGIVALPPKLMAAIDAHAATSLARQVSGVTLPDAEAFSQTVMARVGCVGKGLAERVEALESRVDTLVSTNQQQSTILDGIARQLNLAPASSPAKSGTTAATPAPKGYPLSLIVGIIGVLALIVAIAMVGGPLAMQAINGPSQAEAAPGPTTDPMLLPPTEGTAQPGFEEDPVTEATPPAAAPAPTTTSQRPAPRQPTASAPQRSAQSPAPKASAATPAAAAPSPTVTPDQSIPDTSSAGR